MIVNLTKNNLVYNIKFQLKKNNLKIKIIIFSKISLDSFIITKYLTAVLKSEFISYELFLINNQSEINEFCKKILKIKNDYHIFFFINFGANVNLEKFFLTYYYAIKKIFLLDYHKWYYYKNLTSNSMLIFFDRLYLKNYFYRILDRNKVLVEKKNNFFF